MAAVLLALGLSASSCDYGYVKEPVGPGSGDDTGNGDTTTNQIELTLTPTQAAVTVGGTQSFTALVTGTAGTSVTWSVDPPLGTISGSGLYTAPATIAADPTVVAVRAVSVADTSKFATATVTITRGDTGNGGDTLPPGVVCFERDVLPIFQSNCAKSGCHDVVTQKEGLTFTSYNSITSSLEAYSQHEGENGYQEILEKITEGRLDKRMPPPPNNPLTPEQIETLRRWIEQGAKETKCPETGGCDTTGVTYSGTISPILQNNCTGCHSGANPPKGINLETHAGLMVVVNDGRFRKAVNHLPGVSPMPKIFPDGARLLPDCTRRQIDAWLNQGAPNN